MTISNRFITTSIRGGGGTGVGVGGGGVGNGMID